MKPEGALMLLTTVIVLFIVAALTLGIYYLKHQSEQCIRNPLVFGAKQISDSYGYEFKGSGFLIVPGNYKSPVFLFNSTNLTIQNP